MSFCLFRIRRPHPASTKAVLLPSAVALLLLQPSLVGRESAPVVKVAVAPKYPPLTLAGRVCGEVAIRVKISASGDVTDASVIEGHPMLREASLAAARQWKFAPGPTSPRAAALKFNFVVLPETAQLTSQVIFLPPNGLEIRQKPPSPEVQDGNEDDPGPATNPISST
ncbi:MAG TPA: energy transducer TonB [Methylomirabilota bacterium]|nr:energy transducer TonB [Methylomirabilota bacterium]